jgi:hypothetical protein
MIGVGMIPAAARAQPPTAQPPTALAPTVQPPTVQAATMREEYSRGESARGESAPGESAREEEYLREEYARGEALFSGKIDLHGRIYTHVADMPPTVVRCSNCHAVADGADVPRSLAPRLTRNSLLLPHARRGGPPSNYNRVGFCALLRRGLDPAFVMISVEMPRYTIDDVDCHALWRYLTGSGHEDLTRSGHDGVTGSGRDDLTRGGHDGVTGSGHDYQIGSGHGYTTGSGYE